jgi:hypothetical protein
MPTGASKTLFLRSMPGDLVREAKAAAARRGKTLTAIVAEALARSLQVDSDGHAEADTIERDIAWYRHRRQRLLKRYRGNYLAIIDESIVDHGPDFSALATRVFRRFGNRSVYMPLVKPDEPAARIRSPRVARP